MKGNAKVQEQHDKKTGQKKYFILIPSAIVKALDIQKGNRIDFEIDNPKPEYKEPISVGNNFKKNESTKSEQS